MELSFYLGKTTTSKTFTTYNDTCRFLPNMPPGAVFVLFGVAMRVAEGVGWAMGRITALALLPSLYPSHIGLLTVSSQLGIY